MLYLVTYNNAFNIYGREFFVKGIYDNEDKANQIYHKIKEKDIYITKEEIKFDIKVIPLALNQVYKTSNIVASYDDDYNFWENPLYIGGYEE